MDWLRDLSYEKLFGGIVAFAFVLMFISGGALLIIAIPIGLFVILLKVGVDVYDSVQERIYYSKNWGALKRKIINISTDEYFDTIASLLREIDVSSKPAKTGSNKKWEYLNQNPETALKVYLAIASTGEYEIEPNKRKIKSLANIGLAKIKNSFQYVFEAFEHINDKFVKYQLVITLVAIAHTAPIHLLLIFAEYVLKDYSLYKSDLLKAATYRAQDFNKEDIQKILKLASYPGDEAKFYLRRTKYFFRNAFDFSTNKFKEDSNLWLNKIVQDYFPEGATSPSIFFGNLLNEESSVLLAVACRELGNQQRAISVLEEILYKKPEYIPAITQLVYVYELIGNREKAKNVLIKARIHISSNKWGQNKLREYGL